MQNIILINYYISLKLEWILTRGCGTCTACHSVPTHGSASPTRLRHSRDSHWQDPYAVHGPKSAALI